MTTARTLGFMLLSLSCARAQYVLSARAGMVQFVDGNVSLDGQPVRLSATDFPVLKNGQVLRTDRGLAELSLAPGVFLRMGQQSAVRLINGRLQDTQVELEQGEALVEVVDITKGDRIQVQFGETRTEFKHVGLYRFELGPRELRVFGGDAEVQANDKRIGVGRGKVVRLERALSVASFDTKVMDALHRWAASRSFFLFVSSKEARERRTHWEITVSGWSWNRDFGMRLFSPVVAEEYSRKVALEDQEKADEQKLKDKFREMDQKQVAQQQRQQQQQAGQRPMGRGGP
jgi:hypothetical protein